MKAIDTKVVIEILQTALVSSLAVLIIILEYCIDVYILMQSIERQYDLKRKVVLVGRKLTLLTIALYTAHSPRVKQICINLWGVVTEYNDVVVDEKVELMDTDIPVEPESIAVEESPELTPIDEVEMPIYEGMPVTSATWDDWKAHVEYQLTDIRKQLSVLWNELRVSGEDSSSWEELNLDYDDRKMSLKINQELYDLQVVTYGPDIAENSTTADTKEEEPLPSTTEVPVEVDETIEEIAELMSMDTPVVTVEPETTVAEEPTASVVELTPIGDVEIPMCGGKPVTSTTWADWKENAEYKLEILGFQLDALTREMQESHEDSSDWEDLNLTYDDTKNKKKINQALFTLQVKTYEPVISGELKTSADAVGPTSDEESEQVTSVPPEPVVLTEYELDRQRAVERQRRREIFRKQVRAAKLAATLTPLTNNPFGTGTTVKVSTKGQTAAEWNDRKDVEIDKLIAMHKDKLTIEHGVDLGFGCSPEARGAVNSSVLDIYKAGSEHETAQIKAYIKKVEEVDGLGSCNGARFVTHGDLSNGEHTLITSGNKPDLLVTMSQGTCKINNVNMENGYTRSDFYVAGKGWGIWINNSFTSVSEIINPKAGKGYEILPTEVKQDVIMASTHGLNGERVNFDESNQQIKDQQVKVIVGDV